MANYKAKFVWALRHIFEDDGNKIDEEVSEEFGITKEELNPRKYNRKQDNEEQDNEEQGIGGNQETRQYSTQEPSQESIKNEGGNNEKDSVNGREDNRSQQNYRGRTEEAEVGKNIVNLNDYKKSDYEVRDGDELRVKRLITVLQEELENKYRTIKIGVNFDETNPYQISFKLLSSDNTIQLEFSIYYIYDIKNTRYIYQQDKVSRVESEEKLRGMFGKNSELHHVLDSYTRAVKLNHKVEEKGR